MEDIFRKTTKPVNPRKAFVLMPFRKELEEIYRDIIKPSLEELGLEVYRADEIYTTNAIIADIWEAIQNSALIIADMTGRNPNVFYELGLSHAIGKRVILLTQSMEDVPFDLRHLRCIEYKNTLRGSIELSGKLKKTIVEDVKYTRIPLDILTSEKFTGGFRADHILSSYRFRQYRGSRTKVTEHYVVHAERSDWKGFYKKVNYDGKVANYSIDQGVINARTIFPGFDVWEIVFPRVVDPKETFEFELRYELLDNFARDDEDWVYTVEVDVINLEFHFEFEREATLESFQIFKNVQGMELPVDPQPRVSVQDDRKVFKWVTHNYQKGGVIIFRWKWS